MDMERQPAECAPIDRDLELALIDPAGVHALIFPVPSRRRLVAQDRNRMPIVVHLAHWRDWQT
jgi:hypothetical protein